MILYVTPKIEAPEGTMRPVITCGSITEVDGIILRLREQGWGHDYNVVRGDSVCDFCSTPEITYLYSATSGTPMYVAEHEAHTVTHLDEDGLWAACPTCHKLISADNWNGLRKQSVNMLVAAHPDYPRFLADATVSAAHNFFRNSWIRNGKPAPTRLSTVDEIMGA